MLHGYRGAALAAVAAVAVTGGVLAAWLTTYADWIDGPHVSTVVGALLGGAAALCAAGWCIARRVAAWLVPLVVLVVLLPGPAVHAVRLLNRSAAVRVQLGPLLEYRSLLEPTLNGEATVRLGLDELVLRAPADSVGYFAVRLPGKQSGGWQLPRALLTPEHARIGEELTWQASIERDRVYFALVETDRVQVQMTSWGLLVTTPGPGGEPAGHSVTLPLDNGAWQEWTLLRDGGQVKLLAGAREVWSAPDTGPFRTIRLGETHTDREHGGTLRLRALQFSRFIT